MAMLATCERSRCEMVWRGGGARPVGDASRVSDSCLASFP